MYVMYALQIVIHCYCCLLVTVFIIFITPNYVLFPNCQNATALAAATFNESTP